MNWILEHLQILVAVAAAIAYFLNRSRGAHPDNAEESGRAASHVPDDQAERTRRVQEEIRRKIADRRAAAGETAAPAVKRERVPPMVRPTKVSPIDPFGGPMRKIIRELEQAAETRFEPQPDPEALARAAALERQEQLAQEMRLLEARRQAELRRAEQIAAQRKKTPVKAASSRSRDDVRSGLRDRRELRRVVVMREILGAPVALR